MNDRCILTDCPMRLVVTASHSIQIRDDHLNVLSGPRNEIFLVM